VIDLPGLASTVEPAQVVVDGPQVERVRIGAHSDKVRVVVDGGPEVAAFEGRRTSPAPDGMFVSLGSGDAVDTALAAGLEASEAAWVAARTSDPAGSRDTAEADAALALGEEAPDGVPNDATTDAAAVYDGVADEGWEIAASTQEANVDDALEQAAAEASATDTPATVLGVQYEADRDQGVDRIVVLTDGGAADVDWVATDDETVVVRIPNATIADEASGQIATQEGGPLSMISVFQQPEMHPAEVRVVIKRQAGVVPSVATVGSNVFFEFAGTADTVAPEPAVAEAEPSEAAADELDATATAPSEIASAAEPAAGVDPTLPQMPLESEVADVADTRDAVDAAEAEFAPVPAAATAPAAIAARPGAGPASLEPPAAIDVLAEGGLIDGKEYRGRRISLDFKDVEIADVLRLIAEVSDLNIISGDEVKGKVSIRLVDVPWDQALDVILLTKGLGFVRVGNVLRIAPSDVLAQEEEVRLQERRAKEKLEDLTVKLIPVNYADVKEMQKLIKRLLSSRGSVNIDQRTSTLIIKDISSVIDESTALVQAVDTQTPQVMIEAKIVEASLDFKRELGSVWSAGAQMRQDGFDPSSPSRTDLGNNDFRLSPSTQLGGADSLDVANSVNFLNSLTAQPTALFNLSGFLLNDKFDIDVQLQAHESTGNGKVVSSPRVVTLDNTEAEVAQGFSIPFQTFENGDAKLEFVDAVLSLRVTPHITADKSIIMQIEVSRDAPDATIQTGNGTTAISKNEAKTETLVKDGQTLVLGGIYTIDKSFRQSRVPYLHRIPVIGTAFKSKEVSDSRKELLIFVTPRIVVQPSAAS